MADLEKFKQEMGRRNDLEKQEIIKYVLMFMTSMINADNNVYFD